MMSWYASGTELAQGVRDLGSGAEHHCACARRSDMGAELVRLEGGHRRDSNGTRPVLEDGDGGRAATMFSFVSSLRGGQVYQKQQGPYYVATEK